MQRLKRPVFDNTENTLLQLGFVYNGSRHRLPGTFQSTHGFECTLITIVVNTFPTRKCPRMSSDNRTRFGAVEGVRVLKGVWWMP